MRDVRQIIIRIETDEEARALRLPDKEIVSRVQQGQILDDGPLLRGGKRQHAFQHLAGEKPVGTVVGIVVPAEEDQPGGCDEFHDVRHRIGPVLGMQQHVHDPGVLREIDGQLAVRFIQIMVRRDEIQEFAGHAEALGIRTGARMSCLW